MDPLLSPNGTTTTSSTPEKPPFDYASLGNHADIAEMAALEIGEQLNTQVRAFNEIGRLLCEVKEKLAHGQWTSWLAHEIPFSERAAQNYMSIHFYLGDRFASLQHLKQATVLKIASRNVPEAARKNIIETAGKNSLDDDAVLELVSSAKAKKVGSSPSRAKAPDPLADAIALIMAAVPTEKLDAIVAALAKARQKTLADKLRKAMRAEGKKGKPKAP